MVVTGECNCGTVVFEADVEEPDVFICHCSICRRFTGSNGIAVVLCKNDAFRWLRGEDKKTVWNKPNAQWQANFCSVCGSALPGSDNIDSMFIPAGSISSGGEKLRVAHHIWVDSGAAWDVIGDQGRIHAKAFKA